MTAPGPRLGETFAEMPGALFGFGAYRWSVQWTADGVLVLVGMAGAEHTARPELEGIPQSESAAVARISLDGGKSWVTGDDGEGRSTKASEARLFVLTPPYAVEGGYDIELPGHPTTHFDVNYNDRLPATIRLTDGSYLTVVRYKREREMVARIWRLPVTSSSANDDAIPRL